MSSVRCKEKVNKISVIGAGNVGAMSASRILEAGLGEVVLLDIAENLAIGKAFDISDAGPILGYKNKILGTRDYRDIEGSDIVIVTAGFPRKPGMTREDLLNKNSKVIKEVCLEIKKFAPTSIVIIVTNPLDVMSFLAMKTLGFQPNRVIGCSGLLDTARLINISETEFEVDLDSKDVFVLGSHGDSMAPINRAKIPNSIFAAISEKTRKRGADIVSKLGSGSAYFAPSAAVFKMADFILNDKKQVLCASAYLNGEYGEKDIYIGVPVRLGLKGVAEIIEVELEEEEQRAFRCSAEEIRGFINKLCLNTTSQ